MTTVRLSGVLAGPGVVNVRLSGVSAGPAASAPVTVQLSGVVAGPASGVIEQTGEWVYDVAGTPRPAKRFIYVP